MRKKHWPTFVDNNAKPKLAQNVSPSQSYITYINHASHLIQINEMNILTDPIFSKRAGPRGILGPRRVRNPGIKLNDLPPIQVVLISHNHYDHMSLPALQQLELNSRLSIATHHRTFRLSGEGIDDPVIALRQSMHIHHVNEKTFIAPENGETVIILNSAVESTNRGF